jgi:hypothetical protein
MKRQEFDEIITVMENAGFEVQAIEQGQYTGNVNSVPSYFMRFQKTEDIEKQKG